ncbi:putative Zn-dependent hydrolase of beta-lactamase fold protein [Desulfosporosinus orientis DSM 765]|uniref:Putative Zn-dependent hydrolase of beta-lactamase fold protein n=1 Tax=Desulfosporosinus orientis (strain ATCC 19365 / DSM 765 / NCIMB 8382 / VKM B-1628 / Singapore I) TaxID=768706 RepID=G7WJS2_DESOD|nr:MBL fold metallo-hydrolase [Desulfosporosinus orientis]AET70509.1 putative Zn-dependent hydrolase of beta-lactamase fold protein [Desulfosporosinus orientis DSM 765]
MSIYLNSIVDNAGKTSVLHVGQAGFIFKSKKGITVGVDLFLTDCVERFDSLKRLSPKVVRPDELNLDYIIATHWHLDHFDVDAMPFIMANRKTKLLAAEDCREHVDNLKLDLNRTIFLSEGDTMQCDDVEVHAVFCDHGTGAPLAIGIVLYIDGYKIYIAGDTALRLDKAVDIAEYGPFDVMIAPINGAFGNLNEVEAVSLCEVHKPKLMIPCHFWTFAEHHGDPGKFMEEIKRLPDHKYLIMAAGETAVIGI